MLIFDKKEIKNLLTLDDIYNLLVDWGGEPEYTDFGIISSTICHNNPLISSASRKLYFYENSGLFHCYTGCIEPSFDIFELVIKVFNIQFNQVIDLNDAVRYIASILGYIGKLEEFSEKEKIKDWEILSNYNRIQNIDLNKNQEIILKEYDKKILSNLNYKLKLTPWLKEGISQKVIDKNLIGYYLGGDQISIPHFDINNRFIGLRGRTLCNYDAEIYGKYRPLKINKILYTHPLGMNLYNLNNSKNNIKNIRKAIIFESEKSTLLFQSYFGIENDISVACCGSSISNYQMQLLINLGVEEIIVAFDRQFQKIGDEEFKRLKSKIIKLNNKYKNYINISFIFDKGMITEYKASPIDEKPDKFLKLFKERINL